MVVRVCLVMVDGKEVLVRQLERCGTYSSV